MVATLPRSYGEGVRRQFINRKGHLSELTGGNFRFITAEVVPWLQRAGLFSGRLMKGRHVVRLIFWKLS
jgi:hypothetical protein